MLLWILFVVTVILTYMRLVKPHLYWREKGVIHQTPWPIVGNFGRQFLRLTSMPENIMEIYRKYQDERYFGFYQFLQPVLVLKDIELIKQITIKDFDNFTDHNAFIDEEFNPLFGKNLFSLKGQKWRDMRGTLSPAFTSSKMRAMYTLMSDVADQFTGHFLKKAAETPGKPVTVEMKDTLTRYANDVIATTAFGIQCDSLKQPNNEFYMMGKDATNITGFRALKFFGYTISPLLMKVFKVQIFSESICNFFRNLVHNTIETREREGIVRPDMIQLLMEAKKGKLRFDNIKQEDEGAGFATVQESEVGKQTIGKAQGLTDDEITAQALLFFFAGFDSISGAMCHMSHELAIQPDIQKRLQAEIDEAYEECKGYITYDAILKMKYLDMVVCETLRKWPSGIFTDRKCIKPYTIEPVKPHEKPIRLEKGDIVWLPIYNIHRDPEFFAEPEKFDPERFSNDNKDSIKPFSYIPFGSGPRNCIGSRFALLEVKTVFVYVLSKFDLVVVDKTQIPLKLNRGTFNLMAEKGFWLGLKPRIVK